MNQHIKNPLSHYIGTCWDILYDYLLMYCLLCCSYRAMYDVIDMPWDWPVDVNYHEAKAFCKWKGPEYRLPTEAEHNRMRGDPVEAFGCLV